jgi:hypothetical protein
VPWDVKTSAVLPGGERCRANVPDASRILVSALPTHCPGAAKSDDRGHRDVNGAVLLLHKEPERTRSPRAHRDAGTGKPDILAPPPVC